MVGQVMIPEAARALVGGWATAGRALVAQYLGWIYAAIAIAVLVGAGWSVWRVMSWRTGYLERDAAVAALKAEKDCAEGSDCSARAYRQARDGLDAVERARQTAQEAAQREQAQIAAEGQAAVDRARAAASAATARLRDAEARLRNSISTDATCAAQAREPIRCDY